MSLDTPSLPHSLKSVLETKTFLLTVSVPGDLSDESQKAIVKWALGAAKYRYIVTELGSSDRVHLHALLAFTSPKLQRKIRENVFQRMVKPFHPDAVGRVAVICSVQYNHVWYDEYLKKELDVKVLEDNYDKEEVTELFPTAAVQEALIEKTKIRKSGDPIMAEHDRRYQEFIDSNEGANTPGGALAYLKTRMYIDRDMVVICDKRKLCDKAQALFEYHNKLICWTAVEQKMLLRHQYLNPM